MLAESLEDWVFGNYGSDGPLLGDGVAEQSVARSMVGTRKPSCSRPATAPAHGLASLWTSIPLSAAWGSFAPGFAVKVISNRRRT